MNQFFPRKAASLTAFLLLASSLIAICGCGAGDVGPGKYQVSGVITFQGQPLPEGEIIFAPDASAGNQGPACIAYVKDGKYSTQYGKGLVGGAYKIEVEGFQTKAELDVDGETIVEPLFRTFVTTHEFPHENSTYDLEVEIPKKKRR
ncbi:hypothetical protein M4951_07500 [Blastopirellula sp. J2-11]|uniref:hypothetical protein n=1 Tax=Blastopirellula sp. J2-11 TaxID=2943192 RepID=UPI0021C8E16E|nr:hypothetical protein [Blastopirellula sp. J2-11]UUO08155.1 hypothetical protein M4951_07500 [Blastopirellula sp. J2-11]